MPTLAHKIRCDPTPDQIRYFKQAAGTARFVWNWALAEWNRQYVAGQRPNARALKKQFNAIKYDQFSWLRAIHRDVHSQPFADLNEAWDRFFAGQNNRPVFKKKGKVPDSFYVANDKFRIVGCRVKLPKIGWVRLREPLRFAGKILGARVVQEADQWFLAVAVSMPDAVYYRPRSGDGIEGVDVGVKTFATLSTGENILGPNAHRRGLRRLKIRQRRITRKMQAAKVRMGFDPQHPVPKGTVLSRSRNWEKAQVSLARTHLRVVNIRQDFLHKTSTRLCRENQAIGIETLSVQGMMQNSRLSRAVADQGLGAFFAMLKYKAHRYGTKIVEANRWSPSSKLCSTPGCGSLYKDLTLAVRTWTCPSCRVTHDRDVNAANNLKRLATQTALPVATRPVRDACQTRSDTPWCVKGFGAGRSRGAQLHTDFIAGMA